MIPISVSNSLTKQIPNLKSDYDAVEAVKKSLLSWENIANIKFEVTIVDKQSISVSGKTGDGVNLITIVKLPII